MSAKRMLRSLHYAMNCRLTRKMLLKRGYTIVVSLVLFGSSFVKASDFPYLLKDPLNVRPPILDSGASFPGEAIHILCPEKLDLTHVLELAQAIDLALCNNSELKMAWAGIKVQSSGLGEAKASYLPTISASINQLRSTTRYPDNGRIPPNTEKGQTLYGSLSWRLFDFGAREANNNVAALLLASALAEHSAATQKVLTTVIAAYFDATYAQGAFVARKKAVEISGVTLSSTRNRESKGAVPISDVLQATTAHAKAKLAAQRAEGELQKAISVLINAIGLTPSTNFTLPQTVNAMALSDLGQLQELLLDVAQNHPAILAAKNKLAASKAKEISIRSEGLPTVDFTGNYYQNGYPNQGLSSTRTNVTTIGVALTIPIFDGFASTYKLRGAQAQSERTEAELQEVEQRIMTDVVKAYADARTSLANLDSSESLLEAARSSLATSERRYSKGAADVLELLATQTTLVDAEQERIQCLTQWNSALLRLASSAGKLSRTNIFSLAY